MSNVLWTGSSCVCLFDLIGFNKTVKSLAMLICIKVCLGRNWPKCQDFVGNKEETARNNVDGH